MISQGDAVKTVEEVPRVQAKTKLVMHKEAWRA